MGQGGEPRSVAYEPVFGQHEFLSLLPAAQLLREVVRYAHFLNRI